MRKDGRVVAFCAITIAAPILFFSLVPANGDSALFFDRYMIPATPAFLVLVVAGARAIGSWAGGARLLVIAILVAGLVGIELRYVDHRREQQQGIGLDAVDARRRVLAARIGAVRLDGHERRVLLVVRLRPSGEPARPLPVAARSTRCDLVDDDSCARALPYVTGPPTAASRRLGLLRGVARRRPRPHAPPCACPA